jgi:hypothetical protein
LSTVEEDVFQIIKKVSVEGHDVSESKVSTFFDDEVTVQEQDNFYEQAEASQSLYTKQIVNQENSSATSVGLSTQQQKIQPFCITQQKTTQKKLPKKLENFMNSAAASAALKENLDKKIKLKETYYSEKLTILRDIARSKQEKVIELRRIADILKGVTEKHAFDNMLLKL